jgi:hypothetical protein
MVQLQTTSLPLVTIVKAKGRDHIGFDADAASRDISATLPQLVSSGSGRRRELDNILRMHKPLNPARARHRPQPAVLDHVVDGAPIDLEHDSSLAGAKPLASGSTPQERCPVIHPLPPFPPLPTLHGWYRHAGQPWINRTECCRNRHAP